MHVLVHSIFVRCTCVSHRSRPLFVEPARSLPAMSLLEHTALLRQHLKQTITDTNKEAKLVQKVNKEKTVYYSVFFCVFGIA